MIVTTACSNMVDPSLPLWLVPLIFVLAIWTLFWKGTALWHAARKNHGAWFVILLLFNTVGILDMIYLFGIEKVKTDKLYK